MSTTQNKRRENARINSLHAKFEPVRRGLRSIERGDDKSLPGFVLKQEYVKLTKKESLIEHLSETPFNLKRRDARRGANLLMPLFGF
jgi:hypothetical protein